MNADLTIKIGQDESLVFHSKSEGCTVHADDGFNASHLFLTNNQMAMLRMWLDICLEGDFE